MDIEFGDYCNLNGCLILAQLHDKQPDHQQQQYTDDQQFLVGTDQRWFLAWPTLAGRYMDAAPIDIKHPSKNQHDWKATNKCKHEVTYG